MTSIQNGTSTSEGASDLSESGTLPPFDPSQSSVGYFSPHHLSHGQAQELEEMTGRSMTDVVDLSDLANRPIDTHEKINAVWGDLQKEIEDMTAEADEAVLFGVFPPPVRAKALNWSTGASPTNVRLFESFSRRGKTSGRGPNFEHLQWVETGTYSMQFPPR